MPIVAGAMILNRYRIESFIGTGGMARVWLADDTLTGLKVAIKEPRYDVSVAGVDVQRQFLQEIRFSALLTKAGVPHVVHVWTVESYEGSCLLIMDYLPSSLEKQLLQYPQGLPLEQTVRITRELLTALEGLHSLPDKPVHRDLKPSNILLDEHGRVHLADLGAAQSTEYGPTRLLAMQNIGSPFFAAPEQYIPHALLTPATDLFALGCVLFEMLTSKRYRDPTAPPGRRARALRADVPQWLDEALAKALQEDPSLRWRTAGQMAQALRPPAPVAYPLAQQEAPALPFGIPGQAAHTPVGVSRRDPLVPLPVPGVDLPLVRVPAGAFSMGSVSTNKDASTDEQPQHRVYLDEYLVGRYPVTVAQFRAFVRATAYRTTAEEQGSGWVYVRRWCQVSGADWQHPRGPASDVVAEPDHPVVQVSWDDAGAFCAWASQVLGRTVRLPTEAEWEKAARGTDGRTYPWGNDTPDESHCNFGWKPGGTTPVGHYSPQGDSPYGCVDMAGNVWEWTSSLGKPYPYRADDGREAGGRYGDRVVRGGGFGHYAGFLRAAFRSWLDPFDRLGGLGFRVCASPI